MFKGKLPLLAVSSCMWKTRLIVEKSLSKKIKLQVFVLQTFRIINEMVTIWFRFQIFNMKVKSFPQCLILSIYLLDLLVPTLYWRYGMSTLRENGQFKPKLACFHTFLGIFLGNVDKIKYNASITFTTGHTGYLFKGQVHNFHIFHSYLVVSSHARYPL